MKQLHKMQTFLTSFSCHLSNGKQYECILRYKKTRLTQDLLAPKVIYHILPPLLGIVLPACFCCWLELVRKERTLAGEKCGGLDWLPPSSSSSVLLPSSFFESKSRERCPFQPNHLRWLSPHGWASRAALFISAVASIRPVKVLAGPAAAHLIRLSGNNLNMRWPQT